jgi:hypothetical protein
VSVAAFLAVCCSGTSIAAGTGSSTSPNLAGTWSGKYSGPYSGTFTLHWKQARSRLSGSIKLSNPSGTYGITGSVHGGMISFGAVGAGATYTGSVSGRSMSGHYKTAMGVGTWSAHRTSS